MRFSLFLLYPLYTAALGLVMLAIVPRESIRHLVPFALVFGAVFNAFWMLLFGSLLGLASYSNFNPFGAFGIPFFPPLAWTFFFIVYLYLLPDKFPWNYGFTVMAALYSTIFSHVLQNLQIFSWRIEGVWLPLGVYLIWMFAATLIYQKYFQDMNTYS